VRHPVLNAGLLHIEAIWLATAPLDMRAGPDP
jgi:hypothetical protein